MQNVLVEITQKACGCSRSVLCKDGFVPQKSFNQQQRIQLCPICYRHTRSCFLRLTSFRKLFLLHRKNSLQSIELLKFQSYIVIHVAWYILIQCGFSACRSLSAQRPQTPALGTLFAPDSKHYKDQSTSLRAAKHRAVLCLGEGSAMIYTRWTKPPNSWR